MAQPVRIGFVGCGSVMSGPYMTLATQLKHQGLVEIVAACDVAPGKRQYVLDRFGITNFTADYRELVQSADIDLVLVTTSMVEHGPIARAALEAGKHVLVEKPMAQTLEEARGLVELAKRSPGYLVPAPHVVLSPTFQTIHRRVRNGDIGKVLMARAFYGWAGPSWGPWFYQPGGGSLFDLGVYNVVSLTALIGPAKRVTAMTGVAIPERIVDGRPIEVEAEDTAHVLIDFGESVFAVVTTGFTIQKYRNPAIELYGSTGVIQMMGDDWAPDGYEMWQNSMGSWQIFEETARRWPWTDGLRHTVECIQTGTKPVITPEQAYHVLEIMLKAKDAGRDGRAREIESTFTLPEIDPQKRAQAAHLIHDRSSQ